MWYHVIFQYMITFCNIQNSLKHDPIHIFHFLWWKHWIYFLVFWTIWHIISIAILLCSNTISSCSIFNCNFGSINQLLYPATPCTNQSLVTIILSSTSLIRFLTFHMDEIICSLAFCVWLISLTLMIFSCNQVVANGRLSFFLCLNSFLGSICNIFSLSIHLLVDYTHSLAIVNSKVLNMRV